MVKMDVYESNGRIFKFTLSGHAGYANSGQDIVCAAISALVLNGINSCEKLLDIQLPVDDDGNVLSCEIPASLRRHDEVQLLLHSMVFGVEQTVEAYPKYARLRHHSA